MQKHDPDENAINKKVKKKKKKKTNEMEINSH